MQSRNPVFSNTAGFRQGGPAAYGTPQQPTWGTPPPGAPVGYGYEPPSAPFAGHGAMTIDDVITKTAAVFAVLLVTAAATWLTFSPATLGLLLVAVVVALVLGIVNSVKRVPSPALVLAYGAAEGVVIGGISYVFELSYPGIVVQAVVGTLAAFAAMLGLFATGVLRATPRFQRMMMVGLLGYALFGLVHFVGTMFGLWSSIFANGSLLGLAVSVFAVGLASLSLVLDFDDIERGVRNGVPAVFAWRAAFGLVLTLVWLYLEVLRLLAILSDRD